MYIILRNLISVVRRFKLAAILNLLGLSVAFATFMVVAIQVNYGFGFDKFHKDHNRIFRLETTRDFKSQATTSRPIAERFFESSPHIVAGTTVNYDEFMSAFYIDGDDERNFYREESLEVKENFFDVFSFDIVAGSTDDLARESVVIPLSLSRKAFGNESPIGRVFSFGWGVRTVRAVYRDIPENSIFKNYVYFFNQPNENAGNWYEMKYVAFFKVNNKSNLSRLLENFKRNFDLKNVFGEDFDWEKQGNDLRFTALPDIHFVTGVEFDKTPKTNKQVLLILIVIAIAIITIAAINFTNFSMALTPMRIKSINTQRILGVQRNSLRLAIVFEAVFYCLLSWFVAILFVSFFKTTMFAKLVDADMSLTAHSPVVGGTALVALFVGLLAGFYPASYATSFAPALVLNGSFGLSPKGKLLRDCLIGIQFVASFAFIIVSSFMYLQNRYMQYSPLLGYDKDGLIHVSFYNIYGSRDVFFDKVKSYSGVEDITFSDDVLSGSDDYKDWGIARDGGMVKFKVLPVHHSFLKVMGIKITAGRDFGEEDAASQYGAFVFNETARRRYDIEIGSTVSANGGMAEVVGFMPDVKYTSFRREVEPMAFYVWGTRGGALRTDAYIKIKEVANKQKAMEFVKSVYSEFNPKGYPIEVRSYDEVLQKLYEKEISTGSFISLLCFIAIFISTVGVFGLVIFDCECRRREIGIRKINGAMVSEIIFMFNKTYLVILMICFVVAIPFGWYAVHRWLQTFAYKTPMYWWVFPLAFIAVAVITSSTVTFQSWRVANGDPLKAIKTE